MKNITQPDKAAFLRVEGLVLNQKGHWRLVVLECPQPSFPAYPGCLGNAEKVFFNKVNYNFLANVVFPKDKLQKKIQCILIYTSSKNVACKYNISGYNLIYIVFII